MQFTAFLETILLLISSTKLSDNSPILIKIFIISDVIIIVINKFFYNIFLILIESYYQQLCDALYLEHCVVFFFNKTIKIFFI